MAVSINPKAAQPYVGDPTYDTLLWKGETADPAIVSGTMRSIWRVDGDYLVWHFMMKFAADTTVGTGVWYWTIPGGYSADFKRLGITDSAGANALNTFACVGCCEWFDSGTSYNGGVPVIRQTSGATRLYIHEAEAAGNFFTNGAPITWANLDSISVYARIPIVI